MIITALVICYIFIGILANISFVSRNGKASGFEHILIITIWPIVLIYMLGTYANNMFPLKQIASFFNRFHNE